MNKQILLNEYLSGVNEITTVINGIPKESYDFIPNHKDAWTIRQHIIHLVDSEANSFIRIKSCIAQPYSNIFVINEDDWTKNLENRKEDILSYLSLFSMLRTITTSFLESVSDNDFEEKYFIRNYNNKTEKISILNAVEMYRDHVYFHIDYINKIYDEFRKLNP